MTSFNHSAFGAATHWLHTDVAGLRMLAPGYGRIRVAPAVAPDLTHAAVRHITGQGEIYLAWRIADGTMTVDRVTPVPAEVDLPLGGPRTRSAPGTHTWSCELPEGYGRSLLNT
ncbi:alpha-L-rhamnosidase C-terminal domain-containing protein [Streptomyces sp. NPDC096311]|uniref:alpha-L-rhamnosidase C-terminal domain-containing protein n=1 Tax=Streptomyces sp. NPDC096311 TaxID=3366083 RepID=UPI0038173A67